MLPIAAVRGGLSGQGAGAGGGVVLPAYQQIVNLATSDGWAGVYDPTNPGTRTLRVDGEDNYIEVIADGLGLLPNMVQATAVNQFRLLPGEFSALDGIEAGPNVSTTRYMVHASDAAMAQPNHYIAIAQSAEAGRQQTVFDGSAGAVHLLDRATGNQYRLFAGTILQGANGTAGATADVLSVRFNGASSYIRKNAVQIAAGNAGALTPTRLQWGLRSTLQWVGKLGLLVIYNGAPSDAVRDRMEDLIHNVSGIAKGA